MHFGFILIITLFFVVSIFVTSCGWARGMNLCAGPSLHIYSRYVTAESNTWFMVAVVALTNNSADAGLWCCFGLSCPRDFCSLADAAGLNTQLCFTSISMIYQLRSLEISRLQRTRCCNSLKKMRLGGKNLDWIKSGALQAAVKTMTGWHHSCHAT